MVDNLFGDKPYQSAGRLALPILVRQAEAHCTIFYESLAEEIGMPNERNLNYPLGSIGVTLQEIAEDWGIEVPHIQSIVVSKKTGHPGSGFDDFLSNEGFGDLRSSQKKQLLKRHYAKIFTYPYWDDVLEYCELKRKKPNLTKIIDEACRRGGGEGADHAKLKEFIRTHPCVINLPMTHPHGKPEHKLPSGDSIDIVFRSKHSLLAVEVKPLISDEADLTRGLFQCVKYKAVLESQLSFEQVNLQVDVCLALGGALPQKLIPLRNCLGIRVIENISP